MIFPESELENRVRKSMFNLAASVGKEAALFWGLSEFPRTYLGTLVHENIHYLTGKMLGAKGDVDMETLHAPLWWPTNIPDYKLFSGIADLAPQIVSGIVSWYLLKPVLGLAKKKKEKNKIIENIIKDYNSGKISSNQSNEMRYNAEMDFLMEESKALFRTFPAILYNPLMTSLNHINTLDSDFSLAADELGCYFSKFVPEIAELWMDLPQPIQVVTMGAVAFASAVGIVKASDKIFEFVKDGVNYMKSKFGHPDPFYEIKKIEKSDL